MDYPIRTIAMAVLVATTQLAGVAHAKTPETAATAQHALAVKEDAAQLRADKAALNRQLQRMEADEASLKADSAAGRMSAESRDAYAVYLDRQAIKGGKRDLSADKAASLQMREDKAALHRQIKRLEMAEARLKADTKEGKMAAVSKDAEKVYLDRQAAKAEAKQVAADKAKLKADQST
jgi:hypothetical protein